MTNSATFTLSASDKRRRATAALLAFLVTAPALILPFAQPQAAQAQIPNPLKNMTTKKKVVLLAGAALLFYLYKKHQAKVADQAQTANTPNMAPGGTSTNGTASTVANRKPQLYRSKNGGVYYREGTKAVWLTVPSQPVQVSQDELNQYAPGYQQYQGQRVPPAPRGYTTRSFSDYDPSLMNGNSGGSTAPSGPRGRM